MDSAAYEFIWADFYDGTERIRRKMQASPSNMRLQALDHDAGEPWHLGTCLNEGVARSSGDVLVIPDGDIAVEPDLLEFVWDRMEGNSNRVLYFRRYDEPEAASGPNSRSDIEHLKRHGTLVNPTNYAGCLVLHRSTFNRVCGYETHDAFAGPGISGKELYIRLRNAGCSIQWVREKNVYHPWHPSTGSSGHDEVARLWDLVSDYPWLIPYAGVDQSWIVHRREKDVAVEADAEACEALLDDAPDLSPPSGSRNGSPLSSLRSFVSKLS